MKKATRNTSVLTLENAKALLCEVYEQCVSADLNRSKTSFIEMYSVINKESKTLKGMADYYESKGNLEKYFEKGKIL